MIAFGGADHTLLLGTGSADYNYSDPYKPYRHSDMCYRALSKHAGPVSSVAFSPDGKTIASGSSDDTVRLWEASTGKLLQTLSGHEGGVKSVAFSPDGKTIASGSGGKVVRLWDAGTGRLLRMIDARSSDYEIVSGIVAISNGNDDQRILAADNWGRLYFLDLTPNGNIQYISLPDPGEGAIQQSLDGHYALLTSVTTLVPVDLSTGQPARAFVGHKKPIRSAGLSADGAYVVSGGDDPAHTAAVGAVTFSPDGRYIASGGSDQTIKLWHGVGLGSRDTHQQAVFQSSSDTTMIVPSIPPASPVLPAATQEMLDAMKAQMVTHEKRVARLEFLVEKIFRVLDGQANAPSEGALNIQRKSFDDF